MEQQTQPFANVIVSPSCAATRLPSTASSPKSLTSTARRTPWLPDRIRFSSVVLPAPRKPPRTLIGTLSVTTAHPRERTARPGATFRRRRPGMQRPRGSSAPRGRNRYRESKHVPSSRRSRRTDFRYRKYPPADHRAPDRDVLQGLRVHGEGVVLQDREVRPLAGLDGADLGVELQRERGAEGGRCEAGSARSRSPRPGMPPSPRATRWRGRSPWSRPRAWRCTRTATAPRVRPCRETGAFPPQRPAVRTRFCENTAPAPAATPAADPRSPTPCCR